MTFVSCYHQSQHLQKSEAYNTRTYNFSAERSKEFVRRSKMLTTSTRHGFQNTYPCILGRILCLEERWKLQRLVEVVEYIVAPLDYFRLSHWFWRHPSGVLHAFISKCRMLSELERLDSTTNKGVDYMISSDSFALDSGNNTQNDFNLPATRSFTRPTFMDLGAPATLSGSGDSMFPTWYQNFFHSALLPAGS